MATQRKRFVRAHARFRRARRAAEHYEGATFSLDRLVRRVDSLTERTMAALKRGVKKTWRSVGQ